VVSQDTYYIDNSSTVQTVPVDSLYQPQMVQQQAVTEEVYFVDSSSAVDTTAMSTGVYQQQQEQFTYVDADGSAVYAQETTMEVHGADGSAIYLDQTVVYEQDGAAGGDAGGMLYTEEVQVYEVEDQTEAVDTSGVGEVDCGDVEADCDVDCDF
jgi:hypothetical protein